MGFWFIFSMVTTHEELNVALIGGYQLVIEKLGAACFRCPKCIAVAGTHKSTF